MSHSLPEGSQRLFAHYGEPESLAETASGLVMARLMEEGDSNDLRWLTTPIRRRRSPSGLFSMASGS